MFRCSGPRGPLRQRCLSWNLNDQKEQVSEVWDEHAKQRPMVGTNMVLLKEAKNRSRKKIGQRRRGHV